MIIGYHLVWTVYGSWLPNDPRGSMSHYIRNDILNELGELHYGRKRIQPSSAVIREFYEDAAPKLDHPLLSLKLGDFPVIAAAFAQEIEVQRYTSYACAIMPDHVHILMRKHKHQAEEMVRNFQRESHLRLREAGVRDFEHPVWGGPGWKVFLDCPDDIRRTIKYIDANPRKGRLPDQKWGFVKEYDGWPLHPGHDPNSHYARRLRGPGGG